jgi:hypothetical protein
VTESDKARQVLATLTSAEAAAPEAALQMLNRLIGLARSESSDQPLEIDEARSRAFLSICEVGKALHRGQPTDPLWTAAVTATEHWLKLLR